jgi:hypothetical protein
MSRAAALFLLLMSSSFGASPGRAVVPARDAPAPCDAAADTAERNYGLPSGILAAIGRVESGRADAAGHVAAWPWAIDAAGAAGFPPSAEAAVASVQALQQQGQRNIDVGCFQVNLGQHPDAFATLQAAFDPQANADYAARFLTWLRQHTGSWDAAVAAYHSSVPELGIPYRNQVFAQWTGAPLSPDDGAEVRVGGGIVIAGVRIWTPGIPGTAPRVIRIDAVAPASPDGSILTKRGAAR